jgi:hypothetical protein
MPGSPVYDAEEPRCICGHGEARHTANEVPRGRCEVTILLTMADVQATGRCPCKRFQRQG